jgi:hypothetical protein
VSVVSVDFGILVVDKYCYFSRFVEVSKSIFIQWDFVEVSSQGSHAVILFLAR